MSAHQLKVSVDRSPAFEALLELVESRLGLCPELLDLFERSLVGSFPLNYVDIGCVATTWASDLVLSIQPTQGLSELVTALAADQIDVDRIKQIFHDFILVHEGEGSGYSKSGADAPQAVPT